MSRPHLEQSSRCTAGVQTRYVSGKNGIPIKGIMLGLESGYTWPLAAAENMSWGFTSSTSSGDVSGLVGDGNATGLGQSSMTSLQGVQGKVVYAVGPKIKPFVTGGLARANATYKNAATTAPAGAGQFHSILGWTAGIGAHVAYDDRTSMTAGYNFTKFPSKTYGLITAATPTFHMKLNDLSVGLALRF